MHKRVFVHLATVELLDGEPWAICKAITSQVCGDRDHPGPCPIAAHRVTLRSRGVRFGVRVVFVTEPGHELEVRHRIGAALSTGLTVTVDRSARWRLVSHRPGAVGPTDHRLAAVLLDRHHLGPD